MGWQNGWSAVEAADFEGLTAEAGAVGRGRLADVDPLALDGAPGVGRGGHPKALDRDAGAEGDDVGIDRHPLLRHWLA